MGVILGSYWGYIGVILGLYWGYIGIMEKKMETTISPKKSSRWYGHKLVHVPKSKLLKGVYLGDHIGDFRGY